MNNNRKRKNNQFTLRLNDWHERRETKFIRRITKWVEEVIESKGWERHYDLHIDEIHKTYKNPNTWVNGSLYLYKLVSDIIDHSKYDVYLSICLSCKLHKTNIDEVTIESIKTDLDFTPPSFYMFRLGDKNYEEIPSNSTFMHKLSKAMGMNVYFTENIWEDMTGYEYYSHLWVMRPKD